MKIYPIIIIMMLIFSASSFASEKYIPISSQEPGLKDGNACNTEFNGRKSLCSQNAFYQIAELNGSCVYKMEFNCSCRKDGISGQKYTDVCRHKFIPEPGNDTISYYERQAVLTEFNAWIKWCGNGTRPAHKMYVTNFVLSETGKSNCPDPEKYIALSEFSDYIISNRNVESSSSADIYDALNFYEKYKKPVPFRVVKNLADTKNTPMEQKQVYEEYGVLDKVPTYISDQWNQTKEKPSVLEKIISWIKKYI